MLLRSLSCRIVPVFLIFCLNLSHAQTDPAQVLNNTLQSIQPVTPTTPAAAPAGTPPPAAPGTANPTLGGQAVNSGKYEEYQSICRRNEYDRIKDYPDDLKKKRVDLLQKKMLAGGPEKIKAALRLVKEYLDQDELEQAASLITVLKAQRLNGFDNEFLNSYVALSENKISEARSILNKMVQTEGNENNIEILRNLAEIYLEEQNYYEASTIYEDLNKVTKNSYLPQLCESLVLNTLNADGEKICMQAATKNKQNPFPLIFAGISHRERLDNTKAIELFQRSLKIKPTEMGRVCLAEIHFMDQKFTAAATEFRNALTLNPDSARALLGLAWAELKNKNYEKSIEAFKNACRLNAKYEIEFRKAFKALSADKIPVAARFIESAESCVVR